MQNNPNLSNKELHDFKKQEKIAEKDKTARIKKIKSVSIWVGVSILIIGSIFGLASLANNGGEVIGPALLIDAVSESDWFLGGKTAPVVLVEYGDYQCPACAAYHNFTKQLVAEFGENINFVYRHFPLRRIHPNANLSAQAAEAAGKQGKFWEMHDKLYNNQSDWTKSVSAEKIFEKYALDLGLNPEQFKADLDSSEIKDKINADLASAEKNNLPGTPSFFLNNQAIENPQSYEQFRTLIIHAGATPISANQ